jgi:hypothetical protein
MYKLNKPIFKIYPDTIVKNVQDHLSSIWDELIRILQWNKKEHDDIKKELMDEIILLKRRITNLENNP